MKSSFNSYGGRTAGFGQLHIPVWIGNVHPVPVGGVLPKAYLKSNALYQAGMPVNINDKVLTPFLVMKVTAFESGKVTVDPGNYGIIPDTTCYIQKVGATFAKNGAATAITAVEKSASDPSKLEIATTLTVAAGDAVVVSFSSSGALAPNAYLYNDIWIGDIDVADETAAATGAAVQFHGEGLLVDRTPSADVKAQMAAAVPGVLQVNN